MLMLRNMNANTLDMPDVPDMQNPPDTRTNTV